MAVRKEMNKIEMSSWGRRITMIFRIHYFFAVIIYEKKIEISAWGRRITMIFRIHLFFDLTG